MEPSAESAFPFGTSTMKTVAMSRTIERNLTSNLVIVIPLLPYVPAQSETYLLHVIEPKSNTDFFIR